MVWKVCGEVVPDGRLLCWPELRRSDISSLSSSFRSKVRPELGVLG